MSTSNDSSASEPVKLSQEQENNAEPSKPLGMQFPVSSGQLHRNKENDLAPFTTKCEQQTHHFRYGNRHNCNNGNNYPSLPMQVSYPGQHMMVHHSLATSMLSPYHQHHQASLPPCGSGQLIAYPTSLPHDQMYRSNNTQGFLSQGYSDPPHLGVESNDIIESITQRLSVMKGFNESADVESRLQDNYCNQEAQPLIHSKYKPGHFTGTTGARVLSPAELASGAQAWARKDQLNAGAPVQSGMGMAMLQKMGWRPGEGLGKNKEGTLEPLKLQVKMDKKGLVAPDEIWHNQPQSKDIALNFYEGKHPVSLLNELCLRRRYGPPIFDCCYETGPDHKRSFVFKVTVNGVEYKPTVASQNKKQAKVDAATFCLRALGLI